MVELFQKRPLFAADSESDLLEKIFKVCGTPTAATWPGFAKLAGTHKWKPHESRLEHVLSAVCVPASAQRLVRSLLSCNPASRPTASEALRSPFFTETGDPSDLCKRCGAALLRRCALFLSLVLAACTLPS